jgi:hypothetical protein
VHLRPSRTHESLTGRRRYYAYAAGWKKFEPLWDWVIRARRVDSFLPLLESILAGFGSLENDPAGSALDEPSRLVASGQVETP